MSGGFGSLALRPGGCDERLVEDDSVGMRDGGSRSEERGARIRGVILVLGLYGVQSTEYVIHVRWLATMYYFYG